MSQEPMSPDLTPDDKLWAALSYMPFFGWVAAILALVMDDKKNRPFIKFHAIQALVLAIANGVISSVLSFVVIGICTAIGITIYMCYLGYEAYQGRTIKVPVVTDFIKNQGWA